MTEPLPFLILNAYNATHEFPAPPLAGRAVGLAVVCPNPGDAWPKVMEVGLCEFVDGKPTGKHFHSYVNPFLPNQTDAEKGFFFTEHEDALSPWKLTGAFLENAPRLEELVPEITGFLQGSSLIVHAQEDARAFDQALTWAGFPEDLWNMVDHVGIVRNLFFSAFGPAWGDAFETTGEPSPVHVSDRLGLPDAPHMMFPHIERYPSSDFYTVERAEQALEAFVALGRGSFDFAVRDKAAPAHPTVLQKAVLEGRWGAATRMLGFGADPTLPVMAGQTGKPHWESRRIAVEVSTSLKNKPQTQTPDLWDLVLGCATFSPKQLEWDSRWNPTGMGAPDQAGFALALHQRMPLDKPRAQQFMALLEGTRIDDQGNPVMPGPDATLKNLRPFLERVILENLPGGTDPGKRLRL